MPRGPVVTEEEKTRMRELKAQGLSFTEIAVRLSRDYTTVRKFLKNVPESGSEGVETTQSSEVVVG